MIFCYSLSLVCEWMCTVLCSVLCGEERESNSLNLNVFFLGFLSSTKSVKEISSK